LLAVLAVRLRALRQQTEQMAMLLTLQAQVAVVVSIVPHKQQVAEQMAVGPVVAVAVAVLLMMVTFRVQAATVQTVLSSLQLTSDEYYY
jgi:hypothetical protein